MPQALLVRFSCEQGIVSQDGKAENPQHPSFSSMAYDLRLRAGGRICKVVELPEDPEIRSTTSQFFSFWIRIKVRRWSTFKSHDTHSGLGRSHFHDSAVTDVVSAHETFFAVRRMSTCSFTSSKVSHDFELFICKSERWAELMGSGNQGSQNMDSKICAKRAFPVVSSKLHRAFIPEAFLAKLQILSLAASRKFLQSIGALYMPFHVIPRVCNQFVLDRTSRLLHPSPSRSPISSSQGCAVSSRRCARFRRPGVQKRLVRNGEMESDNSSYLIP